MSVTRYLFFCVVAMPQQSGLVLAALSERADPTRLILPPGGGKKTNMKAAVNRSPSSRLACSVSSSVLPHTAQRDDGKRRRKGTDDRGQRVAALAWSLCETPALLRLRVTHTHTHTDNETSPDGRCVTCVQTPARSAPVRGARLSWGWRRKFRPCR